MNTISDYEIAETMQRMGGGFFRLIGAAAVHADETNLTKLKTIFGAEWDEYRRLTARRLEREQTYRKEA